MGVARSESTKPAPVKERVERDAASGTCPADPPPTSLHPPAPMRRTTRSSSRARALSDADAALEAATHALSPGASDEDSDSDASEPATDGPDDEATDSGSVSLGVDEDGVWVGVLAGDGDFDDASDYDGESTTDDSDDHLDEFDDDAMHFEIEGEIPLGAAGDDRDTRTPVDDEERGVYMLPDGEPIPSVTGMNHAQGSDSVGASSPGRLLVTGPRDVRVLDASETSARGATLGRSEQLLFQVYSVTYDPDAKLVAVCGAVGLASWRRPRGVSKSCPDDVASASGRADPNTSDADSDGPARRDAEGSASRARDGDSVAVSGPRADDSVMFIPVAEKGVGAVGRYGREMLNCVRVGKLARAEADDDASTSTRNVLVCASQDEHCYVLSIEVRGDNGPGGLPVARKWRRRDREAREATAGRADGGDEASTATRRDARGGGEIALPRRRQRRRGVPRRAVRRGGGRRGFRHGQRRRERVRSGGALGASSN